MFLLWSGVFPECRGAWWLLVDPSEQAEHAAAALIALQGFPCLWSYCILCLSEGGAVKAELFPLLLRSSLPTQDFFTVTYGSESGHGWTFGNSFCTDHWENGSVIRISAQDSCWLESCKLGFLFLNLREREAKVTPVHSPQMSADERCFVLGRYDDFEMLWRICNSSSWRWG